MSKQDELRKQLQAQDSFDTGKLEQALAQRKNQDSADDMFDIDEARQILRKSWLGQEIVEKAVQKWRCDNCETRYKSVQQPHTCQICDTEQPGFEDEGVIERKDVWIQVTENPKMNQEGFASLWGTIQPFLTKTTQVSYLREQNIVKLTKSTIRDVINEIRDKHDEYDIDDRRTASQVVNESLTIIMAAINKSREGRSMVSRERTIVEKISRAVGGDDDDESVLGLKFGI